MGYFLSIPNHNCFYRAPFSLSLIKMTNYHQKIVATIKTTINVNIIATMRLNVHHGDSTSRYTTGQRFFGLPICTQVCDPKCTTPKLKA